MCAHLRERDSFFIGMTFFFVILLCNPLSWNNCEQQLLLLISLNQNYTFSNCSTANMPCIKSLYLIYTIFPQVCHVSETTSYSQTHTNARLSNNLNMFISQNQLLVLWQINCKLTNNLKYFTAFFQVHRIGGYNYLENVQMCLYLCLAKKNSFYASVRKIQDNCKHGMDSVTCLLSY